MKLTTLIIALSLACSPARAQDYVDIFRASGNTATLGNTEDDYKTTVNNLNTQLYYPIRVNENLVILSGFTVENTNLSLLNGANRSNLLMTRLNLGIKHQHSEKWSGTYVLFPKIASDFKNIGQQDFQFGALALMDYKVSDTWKIKFGLYSSTENYGTTITPILGLWHRSKNEKFYINASLPITADINYALTKKGLSIGADLLSSIKSYNLSENNGGLYVQEESIRFALYLSHGFMNNALIIRARGGFDTTDYGLFNAGDKIGVQLLTFPLFGDNRNRLNPEFASAPYLGADLIYRFDLTKEKK
jgi:hypothetical protein